MRTLVGGSTRNLYIGNRINTTIHRDLTLLFGLLLRMLLKQLDCISNTTVSNQSRVSLATRDECNGLVCGTVFVCVSSPMSNSGTCIIRRQSERHK